MTTDTRLTDAQILALREEHRITDFVCVTDKQGRTLAYRVSRATRDFNGWGVTYFHVVTLDGRFIELGHKSAGAVTTWVRKNPEAVAPVVVEPEPEEISEPEYTPVAEWSGDWFHNSEDYDPQTVRRRILCDGEWYEAHAVSGPAWPMTVRHLSTFTMVGTLSERTALEAVAAHRVNLEAERAEAERVKVEQHREKVRGYGFTTSDMDALNAAHRGQLPKNHPAIPGLVARGWLVPMLEGSDVLTYSAGAEVAKIETYLGEREGWLTIPEPELVVCPGDAESVEFVEERDGGIYGRLACACRGCLPVKLSPVIRPDEGRAYMNFASVPTGAFGEFVGALGYRMTGELLRGTVTLSSGNVWAWRAPVTPVDGGGDGQDPEPTPEAPTGPVAAQDAPERVTTVTEVDGHHIPSCASCGWVQDNAAFRGENGEEFAQMRAAMHRRQPEFDTGALEPPLAVGDAVWHGKRGAGRIKAISGDTASVHLNLHLYPTDLPVRELLPFTEPGPVTCEIDGVEFTATWETRQYAVKWYGHTLQVGPTAGEVFRRLETGLRDNPEPYAAEMAQYGPKTKTKQQGEQTVGRSSRAPKKSTAPKVGDIVFTGDQKRGRERAELLGHVYKVMQLDSKYFVTHVASGVEILKAEPKRAAMKRLLLADVIERGPVVYVEPQEQQPEPLEEPAPVEEQPVRERCEALGVDFDEPEFGDLRPLIQHYTHHGKGGINAEHDGEWWVSCRAPRCGIIMRPGGDSWCGTYADAVGLWLDHVAERHAEDAAEEIAVPQAVAVECVDERYGQVVFRALCGECGEEHLYKGDAAVADSVKDAAEQWAAEHAPQHQAAADTEEKAPEPGEPGFMAALLEKHVGPHWKPLEATADPEFAEVEEEPQAPVQGLAQVSQKQRAAAWRIAAGEPAPDVKVTPVGLAGYVVHDGSNHVDLTVPPMLEAAPVRAALVVGQRAPIATPYTPPARTFATPYRKPQPNHGRKYWESGERVTLNHRAGRTTSSRDGRVRVAWDDAPEWQGTFVPVEELWLEGTEPQPRGWFAPVVMPEPLVDDEGPDYAAISAANHAAAVNEQHQEEPEPAPAGELDAPSMTWDEVSSALADLWTALHEEQEATTPSRGWEELTAELSTLGGELRRPEPVVMPVRVPRTLRRDLMTIAAAGALVTLTAASVAEVVAPRV
ncbi:hypothetical protein [Streptomyces sp. NPDC096033]|uniref:hypothetical protein n=1 Tax=Streptomyces sp. NPDC096033 TaxID=3366071 RepID=UPI0038202547